MTAGERTRQRWPDPVTGPYDLTVVWVRRPGGRADPVGVMLVPVEGSDPPALTSTTLRSLNLAGIAAEHREDLPPPPAPPARLPAGVPAGVPAGMRPATLRRLQRVADIYRQAWEAGGAPTQAVERRLQVSTAAAGNLVRRARAAGLLPPTTPGRPQGR